MEDDFVFPDRPADLCDPRCELPLRCVDLVDVSGLEREDLDEFVDRTSWEFFGSVFFQFRRRRQRAFALRRKESRQLTALRTRIGSSL